MFNKNSNISGSNERLDNFIDGIDVYNSEFLLKLFDPDLPKVNFIITTQKYRPDLIAEDFYKSSRYSEYVILQAGLPLSELKQGVTLQLIPLTILKKLINEQ